MARRMTTEDHLALLRQLKIQAPSPAGIDQLRSIFHSKNVHGIAIKSATEIASRWNAKDLLPALQAAAESLSPAHADAPKRDPGCEGKEAVLRVLVEWDADIPDFFIAAAQWTQHESTWAPSPEMKHSKDTAAECRGLAAIGLAQTRARTPDGQDAWALLIELLVDPESATRARAAQALAIWRGPESIPILRTKAHLGDPNPEVIGEVLLALLRQDLRREWPFVARFLDHDDPRVAEAAAMALGETRNAASLPLLIRAWQRLQRDPVHTSILMAIALLRHEDSLAWLLGQIATARPHTAAEMLQALALYKGDERTVTRIGEALSERTDLAGPFSEIFGAP